MRVHVQVPNIYKRSTYTAKVCNYVAVWGGTHPQSCDPVIASLATPTKCILYSSPLVSAKFKFGDLKPYRYTIRYACIKFNWQVFNLATYTEFANLIAKLKTSPKFLLYGICNKVGLY